jgi:hypothetical protein
MNTTPSTSELPPAGAGFLPAHCELAGPVLCFRPRGKFTLVSIRELTLQVIYWARQHQVGKLLINGTAVEGVPSPNLADRYFYMREFAAAAAGVIKLAAVLPREAIDPEKFGVVVGRNAGLDNDVFTNEAEALAWLNAAAHP